MTLSNGFFTVNSHAAFPYYMPQPPCQGKNHFPAKKIEKLRPFFPFELNSPTPPRTNSNSPALRSENPFAPPLALSYFGT
jgi:hypothetical protein